MSSAPFTVTLYDKAFTRIGWVNDFLDIRATPRHNALGTAEFTVRSSHRYAGALLTPGTRVVIGYQGSFLMSGPVRGASGNMATGALTFRIEDDFRLLSRILGWPVPGSAIGSQSGSEYYTVTDNAETVVKTIVGANATRLSLPLTVATDLGRGDVVTVAVRMHPIADRLLPVIDTAGIGVTVRQVGAGLVLDCYAPTTYPRTLTAASGVVRDWEYSATAHKATRAVVGGGGDGTAREFRAITGTALESATGDVVEVFVDARDTNDNTVLDQRAQDAITEGAPTSGISVTLAESKHFRYGVAASVGDILTISPGPGLDVTEVMREATLSWNASEGLRVRPAVGDPNATNPINTITKSIAALARGFRNQNARS